MPSFLTTILNRFISKCKQSSYDSNLNYANTNKNKFFYSFFSVLSSGDAEEGE
jgi:hypothetical protein